MKPIRRGELQERIQAAFVEFLDSGERVQLTTKRDSRCHFFDPILIEDEKVVLRIDWGAIDENGRPILDADFYNPKTGKKRKARGKWQDPHHTNASGTDGRTYEWKFEGISRSFRVIVHWLASVDFRITMGARFDAEVIKKVTPNEKV